LENHEVKTGLVSLRAIAFGFFLTSELQKKPEPVCVRLLTVLICSYIALKKADFRIEKLADAD
jgi:hypothetical protein